MYFLYSAIFQPWSCCFTIILVDLVHMYSTFVIFMDLATGSKHGMLWYCDRPVGSQVAFISSLFKYSSTWMCSEWYLQFLIACNIRKYMDREKTEIYVRLKFTIKLIFNWNEIIKNCPIFSLSIFCGCTPNTSIKKFFFLKKRLKISQKCTLNLHKVFLWAYHCYFLLSCGYYACWCVATCYIPSSSLFRRVVFQLKECEIVSKAWHCCQKGDNLWTDSCMTLKHCLGTLCSKTKYVLRGT